MTVPPGPDREAVWEHLRSESAAEWADGSLEELPEELRDQFANYGTCPECGSAAVLPAKWSDRIPYRCFDCGAEVVHPDGIDPGGSLGDSVGCFVATAAYGTPLAPEIDVLRRFRDEVLASHAATRWLVPLYYRTSPPFARWIARSERRRELARRYLLEPMLPLVRGLLDG